MTPGLLEQGIELVVSVGFGLVAARALLDWRRQGGGRPSFWIACTFGLLFVITAAGLAFERIWGTEPPTSATKALVILILLYPAALARFFGVLRGGGHRFQLQAWIATMLLVIWTLFIPSFPQPDETRTAMFGAYTLSVSAVWAYVSLRVVAGLWRMGRGCDGIVKGRKRLLAAAILILTISLLLAAALPGSEFAILRGSVSAAAAVLTFLAYAPPTFLRNHWRRDDQNELRSAIGNLMSAPDRKTVGDVVLPKLGAVLGARSVAILDQAGAPIAAHEVTDVELCEMSRCAATDAGWSEAQRVIGNQVWSRHQGWFVVVVVSTGFAPRLGSEEGTLLASTMWLVDMAIDRIEQINRVHEREAKLLAAQNIAGLGGFTWHVAEDVVEWTDTLYDIFGVDHGTSIGVEAYIERVHADDREHVLAKIASAQRGLHSYDLEHRIVRPDGTVRVVDARGRPVLDEAGSLIALTGVVHDVTDRAETEQSLRAAVDAKRDALERLRAIDSMKDMIIAAVSHEMRTPLTTVLGMSATLTDRWRQLPDAQRLEMVQLIRDEGERLDQLLADMLDLDQLRRGVIEPRRDPVDLRALVEQVVARNGADVCMRLEEVTCNVDAGKVQRIVENLVSNAARHTPDGTRIEVSLEEVGTHVRLCVEDDGPGIPETLAEAVFEPFNRGERKLGHAPGTGIGLALVRNFAELHGGTARVEASRDGGARFVILLPSS